MQCVRDLSLQEWWVIHRLYHDRYSGGIRISDIQRVWGIPYSSAARIGQRVVDVGLADEIRSALKLIVPIMEYRDGVQDVVDYLWREIFTPPGSRRYRDREVPADAVEVSGRDSRAFRVRFMTVADLWALMGLYRWGAEYLTTYDMQWVTHVSGPTARTRMWNMHDANLISIRRCTAGGRRLIAVPVDDADRSNMIRTAIDSVRQRFVAGYADKSVSDLDNVFRSIAYG